MAVVYLARDLKHERQVALKVIKPELAGRIGRSRFSREIKVAARLQHPHICSVYDSGATEDDQLWYTMPYVAGESLRDRLRRDTKLPISDAIRIAREAAQGLEFAHKQGVIHRDIKPENLLLTEDGTTLVADFGIAKGDTGSGEAQTGTQLTDTGYAIGTPAYMSPEQRLGAPVDVRTDIYSLGATLYEALLGELPPAGGIGLELFLAQMTDATPRLKVKRAEISAALEEVVRQAIASDPAKRFQTMGEFRQALDALSTGRTGVTKAGRSGRFLKLGIAAGFVALVGFGGRYAWARWTTPTREVIAIVPFATAPGDSTLRDIAWNFAEDLRRGLPHVPGWKTATEAPTQRVTAGRISPREIAQALGAEIVVKGEMVRAGDGFTLTLDVSRPSKGNEAKRATLSGSLKQLMDLRDSMATLVLTLGGARPDPEDIRASGRFRISTEVPEAYALYGQVYRQNYATGGLTSRAVGDSFLAKQDSLLARDPRFIDALSDNGMFTIQYREGFAAALSAEESAGLLRRATDLLTRARAVDPTHPLTERLEGYLLLTNGDTAGALVRFRRNAEVEPVFQLLSDLCSVEVAQQRPPSPTPQSCVDLVQSDSLNSFALTSSAYLLQYYGRAKEALEVWRALARLEPTKPEPRLEAARTLRMLNRIDESVAELRKAAQAAPTDPLTHQLLASSLMEAERPEESLREARAMVEGSPGDLGRLAYYGRLMAIAGHTDSAVAIGRQIVATAPKSAAPYVTLGQWLWADRQFDAALTAFATAARLEEQNPGRHFTLDTYLRLAGRLGNAQAALDRGLASSSNTPAGRSALARHLIWIGKADEAIAALEPLAARDSLNAGLWITLSYYQNLAGHPDLAITAGERAVQLDSTQASAYSNLAMARFLLGDKTGAIRESDRLRHANVFDQANIAQQVWFYARGGQRPAAQAKLDSLVRRSERVRPSLLPLIIAYAGVGDTTKARALVAESAARREAGWLNFLPSDPLFADLRGTPEYQAMMRSFLQSGDGTN